MGKIIFISFHSFLSVGNFSFFLRDCSSSLFSISVRPSHCLYVLLTLCTQFSLSVRPSHCLYTFLTLCTSFSLSVHISHSLYVLLTVCTHFSPISSAYASAIPLSTSLLSSKSALFPAMAIAMSFGP